MHLLRFSLLAGWWLAMAVGGRGEETIEGQVRALGRRFQQVEEQLPRSVEYAGKEEGAEGTVTKRAWFDGTGELLKLAVERRSGSTRELTEYFGLNSELTYDGLFVLTRRETAAPDGGTQVEETRRYYGRVWAKNAAGYWGMDNGVLLREQRKSAHFAVGEVTDTVKAKNVVTDYPKTTPWKEDDEGRVAKNKLFEEPQQIADALREKGSPAVNPTAGIVGDSARFRTIRGSISPDGRLALAIGFAKAPEWSTYRDTYFEHEEVYTAEGADGLRNYVVDVTTNRILGETGGDYFGTRQRYNHREMTVFWAEDSHTFVALYDDKWNYESCFAGRLVAGPKWVGVIDLGKLAERQAMTLPKARRNKEASIALSVQEVKNDGTVVVEVIGQASSGANKGDVYFTVAETFRLREEGGRVVAGK